MRHVPSEAAVANCTNERPESIERLRGQLEAMCGKRPDWLKRMKAADQIVAQLLGAQGEAIKRARRGPRAMARAAAVA
jgi:hypothetical protein